MYLYLYIYIYVGRRILYTVVMFRTTVRMCAAEFADMC